MPYSSGSRYDFSDIHERLHRLSLLRWHFNLPGLTTDLPGLALGQGPTLAMEMDLDLDLGMEMGMGLGLGLGLMGISVEWQPTISSSSSSNITLNDNANAITINLDSASRATTSTIPIPPNGTIPLSHHPPFRGAITARTWSPRSADIM